MLLAHFALISGALLVERMFVPKWTMANQHDCGLVTEDAFGLKAPPCKEVLKKRSTWTLHGKPAKL
ncbi:hypothetical protein XH87_10320 [Bradyrhizobium sp. CCBAU 53415]|nr:hypothetical protein [Bradyrhizobium sp. CCBAU 53415]